MAALMRSLATAFLVLTLLASPGLAVEPDEMLDDPVLEARAREISKDVRCLVCQNENIDESNADLARDLRLLVRERLVAGDSNQEVFDYLVARYGDWVLFKPPFKPATWALWIAPFALIGVGGVSVVVMLARRPRRIRAKDVALSEDEEREFAAVLDGRDKEG